MSNPTPTTEQIVTLLRANHVELAQLAKDAGPCDHAVNVCVCGIMRLADDTLAAADALASSPVSPRGAPDAYAIEYMGKIIEGDLWQSEHKSAAYAECNRRDAQGDSDVRHVIALYRAASSGGATERGTTFEEKLTAALRAYNDAALTGPNEHRPRMAAALRAAGCGSQS